MLSPTPTVKFTYQDYQHTPDDQRYELLDGELIMVPAPNLGHQQISISLGARLYTFVQKQDLGKVFHAPCDVVLSNTDVVQPDLLFVSHERAHLLLGGANVLGAPDWSKFCRPPPLGRTECSNAPCMRNTVCRNTGWSIQMPGR